jgi:hypothetical protein
MPNRVLASSAPLCRLKELRILLLLFQNVVQCSIADIYSSLALHVLKIKIHRTVNMIYCFIKLKMFEERCRIEYLNP